MSIRRSSKGRNFSHAHAHTHTHEGLGLPCVLTDTYLKLCVQPSLALCVCVSGGQVPVKTARAEIPQYAHPPLAHPHTRPSQSLCVILASSSDIINRQLLWRPECHTVIWVNCQSCLPSVVLSMFLDIDWNGNNYLVRMGKYCILDF